MVIDLDRASAADLVAAASAIAAELAHRSAPVECPAACLEQAKNLSAAIDRQEAALTALIGVVDRAGEVKRWGYPSTRAWLRSELGMRGQRASERLTLARHRDRLPELTERWTGGTLHYGYAATIAEAVSRLNDTDCAAAERLLLQDVDNGFSPGKIAEFGRKIRETIAERDGTTEPDVDARRGFDRSWIQLTRCLAGGRFVKGWLNAEDAAIWDTTLSPLAKPTGPDDPRDIDERIAAALATALSDGHAHARVTVIVDLETLTGGNAPARLADGTPVPAAHARRLALSAGVTPLLLGNGNTPLYLGHRVRFASPGQRRVLETIYPTCAVRECEIPGTACEVDHVDGWALGNSPTDIDRLTLTCGWHNRFKHTNPHQIHIARQPDGRYLYRLLPPPDIRHRHQRKGQERNAAADHDSIQRAGP